jgi:hypothetical protein
VNDQNLSDKERRLLGNAFREFDFLAGACDGAAQGNQQPRAARTIMRDASRFFMNSLHRS